MTITPEEQIRAVVEAIANSHEIMPSGGKLLLNPKKLSKIVSGVELRQILTKLEQDEKILKIKSRPNDFQLDEEDGCYDLVIQNYEKFREFLNKAHTKPREETGKTQRAQAKEKTRRMPTSFAGREAVLRVLEKLHQKYEIAFPLPENRKVEKFMLSGNQVADQYPTISRLPQPHISPEIANGCLLILKTERIIHDFSLDGVEYEGLEVSFPEDFEERYKQYKRSIHTPITEEIKKPTYTINSTGELRNAVQIAQIERKVDAGLKRNADGAAKEITDRDRKRAYETRKKLPFQTSEKRAILKLSPEFYGIGIDLRMAWRKFWEWWKN